MKTSSANRQIISIIVTILWCFPFFWMILSGFKQEVDVVNPSLRFSPTLEHYVEIFSGAFFKYFTNSVIVSISATFIAAILGIPITYWITIIKRGDKLFFWFVSTILLPPICSIVPLYLVLKYLNVLDNLSSLILIYGVVNTPLVIWMMRSFFKDIPKELIEASRIDGCNRFATFMRVVMPLSRHGISATLLLVMIFVWNEFPFALSFTYTQAATLPVYLSSFMMAEGLFWGKMCAISTIAVIPPILLGWINQKQLVRGLTLGAVKG